MLRALTLWRPWDVLMLLGFKRVENRSWCPPQSLFGQWFAIHSGVTYDKDGERWARQQLGAYEDETFLLTPESKPRRIIGLLYLESVVDNQRPASLARLPQSQHRWKNGDRYGWYCPKVERLLEPVQCAGRQGLWQVPRDLEAVIRRQVPAYVNAMIGSQLPTLPGLAR